MIISLIAAMGNGRVIGIENRLPWRLPADMQWFRKQTMGKPVIMGRHTFESIGKPLPGRENIIISRDPHYHIDGAIVVPSLDAALACASCHPEAMIIGGASLYAQSLPRAQRLYLTLVHADFAGDAWFPEYEMDEWREIEHADRSADEKNPHPYSFLILERGS